jgi:uncharacterized protein
MVETTAHAAVEPLDVTIRSGSLSLAGHLRLPHDAQAPAPGIVFTGPLSGVKEQVTGTYAAALAGRGYVTLAFDHRNFGASDGSPRQHEDAAGKRQDLLDATGFLAARREVDASRLASVGVCLGGSYALLHAAFDPRIRALGLVAGGYNEAGAMRAGMGHERYRRLLLDAAEADAEAQATGQVRELAAVAADGGPAVMSGDEPFAYYGTDRASSPGWHNRLTFTTIRELVTLDATAPIALLADTPTVMVHGRTDAYCSPDQAAAVFERLPGLKDLVWLDTTNHIDLYDVPRYVDAAVDCLVEWFDRHLMGA